MSDRSDVDLMLALKAGDEAAFGLLVRRHQRAVMNLTYRYLSNRADAEDLAQDVFLKVYRARHRYEPQAKFTTWLYRIAVNACLNEVRSRKNRAIHGAAAIGAVEDDGATYGRTLADEDAASPVEAAEKRELREQVRAAVDELPERQRLALLLNKFHGLSYEELAESLEMTIPAVKSLLVRARENVRTRIEPYLRSGADRWSERKGTA